jgi:Tfp pilus assembly protein PilV
MRQKRSEEGFTLIDALVGMTVLAVSSQALLGMLLCSVFNVRANSLQTHAVTLAIQEREDLRSLAYSAIATRDPYTTSSPNTFSGMPFTVHSEVQNGVPIANTKTVTVTTSWSFSGQARSYSLQTIFTNING